MTEFMKIFPCAAMLCCLVGTVGEACAQGAEFAGRWRIASSVITAPWAEPGGHVGANDLKRMLGKTVNFGPRAVTGPAPIGCSSALYVVRDDAPEMLFEGALAELARSGSPRDATAMARDLGMTTPTVRTLSTGCSQIEFHRVEANRIVFALNDHIYTLHRD